MFFVLLLVGYQAVGSIWGLTAKIYFAVGIFVVWVAAAVATLIMRRHLRKNFKKMDAKTREQLLAEHPDVIEAMASTPAPHWKWKLMDTVLALMFVVIPFLIVSVAMKQPLSWDSSFTGYHLLGMAGGLGIYSLGRVIAVKWWKQKP